MFEVSQRTVMQRKITWFITIAAAVALAHQLQKEAERLLLIKSLDEKWDDLKAFIKSNHSYSVPEIVAVRTDMVSDGYLGWLKEYLT